MESSFRKFRECFKNIYFLNTLISSRFELSDLNFFPENYLISCCCFFSCLIFYKSYLTKVDVAQTRNIYSGVWHCSDCIDDVRYCNLSSLRILGLKLLEEFFIIFSSYNLIFLTVIFVYLLLSVWRFRDFVCFLEFQLICQRNYWRY